MSFDNFTNVDLGNYLRHRQNMLKILQVQQTQKTALESRLVNMSNDFRQQVKEMRLQLSTLQRVWELSGSGLAGFQGHFRRDGNAQRGSEKLLRYILKEIYELPAEYVEAINENVDHERSGLYFGFSVETNCEEFFVKEAFCGLLKDSLIRYFHIQYPRSRINANLNNSDNLLQIDLYITGKGAA